MTCQNKPRAEFEAWAKADGHEDFERFGGEYAHPELREAWRGFKAGQASLQSQDREGYAGVTVWIDGVQCTKIITRIQYESSNADELLRHFEAARAAIDHARQFEGDDK